MRLNRITPLITLVVVTTAIMFSLTEQASCQTTGVSGPWVFQGDN